VVIRRAETTIRERVDLTGGSWYASLIVIVCSSSQRAKAGIDADEVSGVELGNEGFM
jgi:hypothetical protein